MLPSFDPSLTIQFHRIEFLNHLIVYSLNSLPELLKIVKILALAVFKSRQQVFRFNSNF